jgi:UDP-N-acetylglucosamine:LPS N-acetylglucosamine transferase
MRSPTYAIIAGGGTAGHVVPGLAIAAALVERGHPPTSIHYVGSERGIERTMVPAAGYSLTLLPGRGIQRRLTWANVGAVLGLLAATWRGVRLLRRRRPAVLVALGGYASVPAALGAILWRVPIIVAEQNAVPGAANRLVARFAKASAVSFAGTARCPAPCSPATRCEPRSAHSTGGTGGRPRAPRWASPPTASASLRSVARSAPAVSTTPCST